MRCCVAGPAAHAMTELAKSFEPAAIEARWGPLWEASGAYAPTLDPAKPSFSIQLPPPNVTGTLHMGHAFNHTIMDALIRYHRMKGFNTLWLPGTDHAGIATQIVVERQLQDARQEPARHRPRGLPRSACGSGRPSAATPSPAQMRRLGDTVDWSREYFTMDATQSAVVNETFVRLYEEGLIYRGKRLVSWDPVLRSAVSDLEVESEEEDGFLWHIRYPLADGSGSLVVATTRPETMLGDTAVMVHPEDERYTAFVGKQVRLPLMRPADPGDRRRLRRPRVRHRRGQGDAGARRQRLCGRPAPRAADDRRAGAGRDAQRQRPAGLPRPGPLRRAQEGGRRPRRAGPAGRDQEAPPGGAALRAHRADRRADAHRPVVHGDDASRAATASRSPAAPSRRWSAATCASCRRSG